MRRASAILKYLPTVLCGLLVVAWVVSVRGFLGFASDSAIEQGHAAVGVTHGSILCASTPELELPTTPRSIWRWPSHDPQMWSGALRLSAFGSGWALSFPLPFLLTLLLPLATGPFHRFRFPLWTWFAFTAIVAIELAYYLRASSNN